jgi:hypothetical protein
MRLAFWSRAFLGSAVVVSACAAPAETISRPSQDIVISPPRIIPSSSSPKCPALAPVGNDLMVLYGTHDGAAVSTTGFAGQELTTTVADVVIERGKQPLYLILTSAGSVIWRVSGDVKRVSSVLISTWQKSDNQLAAGVVGILPRKIAFVERECARSFSSIESVDAARSRGAIRNALGREPDVVAANYETSSISLPSAILTKRIADRNRPPVGFDLYVWRDALAFWPSGITNVSAKDVISPSRPVAYDVLPSQAGIAWLVGAGALKRIEGSGSYKIMRPIPRFPPDMGGAHSAKFLLGRGVPLPKGSPGHSCVVSEETGEILSLPILCGP